MEEVNKVWVRKTEECTDKRIDNVKERDRGKQGRRDKGVKIREKKEEGK